MIIDAGQKNIGAQHCTTCNFVYSEDPSEQKAHEIRHARALGYIDFKGWKKENKIDCPELDGRIVIVKYHDANNHWDKVCTNLTRVKYWGCLYIVLIFWVAPYFKFVRNILHFNVHFR